MCGTSGRPCPIYEKNLSICSDCSFRLTILGNGIVECAEIMQDIFKQCPRPRELGRVFSFIGTYLAMLFEGTASKNTQRNIWKVITGTYAGKIYGLPSKDFFDHPDHLETIKKRIREDSCLLNILRSDAFTFAIEDRDEVVSDQISLDTAVEKGTGIWNLGEQLVLESMKTYSDFDEEEELL